MSCVRKFIRRAGANRGASGFGRPGRAGGAVLMLFGAALSFGASPAGSQPKTDSAGALDCVMEPRAIIKLASPVGGIVDEIIVDRGDTVAKGQVVARLRSGVERATVALARARADSSIKVQSTKERAAYENRKLSRSAILSARNVLSDSKLDDARTENNLAEMAVADAEFEKVIAGLELARAEELLALRSIRSPVDGVVTNRLLSPGEYSNEQAQIATIAQMDPLYVEVYVPIAAFGKIKPGMTAEVRPEAPVGGVYLAKVNVVDTVFDAASRTFGVRLLLPNPQHQLPGGMRCKVHFDGIAAN